MNELHHLAGAYAVDALEGDERREFEAHYQSCEICMSEVAEFRETAAHLGDAIATAVPPGLKDLIMAEVAETRQDPVPVLDSRRTVPASAVADRAVPENPAGGDVIDFTKRRPFRDQSRVLALVGAVLVLAGLSLAIVRLGPGGSSVEPLLAAPDLATAQLEGSGVGAIRVIWSADRDEALVIADDLPTLASGQTYELWFLLPDDGGVSPAGLFNTDDGSVFKLIELEDIQNVGWGVTVEPSGGSQSPTGPVIFSGSA